MPPAAVNLAYTSEHHNAVVVSPCDHLCMEAPYPASANDCHAAYQYILEHAQELKIDTSKIVIHGYSSGGHMALCLGFRLKRYGIKARGIVASLPIVDDVNANQSDAFSYYNEENGSIEAWDGEAINATMQLWLKGQTGNPMLPPRLHPTVPRWRTVLAIRLFGAPFPRWTPAGTRRWNLCARCTRLMCSWIIASGAAAIIMLLTIAWSLPPRWASSCWLPTIITSTRQSSMISPVRGRNDKRIRGFIRCLTLLIAEEFRKIAEEYNTLA